MFLKPLVQRSRDHMLYALHNMLAKNLDPFFTTISEKDVLQALVAFMEKQTSLEEIFLDRALIPKSKIIFEWEEMLYCNCLQPYFGDKIIQCDMCKAWYHEDVKIA